MRIAKVPSRLTVYGEDDSTVAFDFAWGVYPLKYSWYSTNGENNDCFLEALSIALEVPIEKAWALAIQYLDQSAPDFALAEKKLKQNTDALMPTYSAIAILRALKLPFVYYD